MVLANAHLDGIPASGSPGLELLADLFNKPIEEMRAEKRTGQPDPNWPDWYAE